MTTMRFFQVTFKGATDYHGSRVLIRDLRFNRRRTINYDYGIGSIIAIATQFLKSKGIEITCAGENIDSILIGTENFDTQI